MVRKMLLILTVIYVFAHQFGACLCWCWCDDDGVMILFLVKNFKKIIISKGSHKTAWQAIAWATCRISKRPNWNAWNENIRT